MVYIDVVALNLLLHLFLGEMLLQDNAAAHKLAETLWFYESSIHSEVRAVCWSSILWKICGQS